MNVGPITVDFQGARFTSGIQFEFDQAWLTELAPGERLLIVNDRTAFEKRYGQSNQIAGSYTDSRLDNDGELLRLVDRDSETMVDVTYAPEAPWPLLGSDQALYLREPVAGADLDNPGLWNAAPANPDASPPVSFDRWMQERGLTKATEDPDGNGLSHLAEYALGLDLEEGRWAEIRFAEDGSVLITHHARLASGYTFELERSFDLVAWETQPFTVVEQRRLSSALEARTVRLVTRDNRQPFYRLRILRSL